jgi:hypothetical protein
VVENYENFETYDEHASDATLEVFFVDVLFYGGLARGKSWFNITSHGFKKFPNK